MRKMYFGMVPKSSFLKDTVVTVGLGAALVYGAKRVLGDDKFNGYKERVQEKIFSDSKTEAPVWGGEAKESPRHTATARGDGSPMDRVRGALRLTKGAAKLLLAANTKLLNILSKEDTEE